MNTLTAVLLCALMSTMVTVWAQNKPLKLTPTPPPPGEKNLQRTLREHSNEEQPLLCTVNGKNYAATNEDEGKCTEMGGSMKPGVDNSAGNIKYVPVMTPANKANKMNRRAGPHDKGDPLQPDN